MRPGLREHFREPNCGFNCHLVLAALSTSGRSMRPPAAGEGGILHAPHLFLGHRGGWSNESIGRIQTQQRTA
jgi:hypothetical protein